MNNIIRFIIAICILVDFCFLGIVIIDGKAEEKSQKPPEVVPQVDIISIQAGEYKPSEMSYGTVQSYFETHLTPEVNGKITSISDKFRVGEMVNKGETLATIDAADYQSALATKQANLILQKAALAEEEIRAAQATADWKASGRDIDTATDFVLRKPQLAAARANIDAAQTAIKKAELDLARTHIKAPYNAVVTNRTAALGNYATAQSTLGSVIATEKAEIRIPLTAEQMMRIKISDHDQPEISLTSPANPDVKWTAKLTRIEPTIDPKNQVSYAIATIDHPYKNEIAPLPVGSFVNISIPTTQITNAYKIPESAIVNDSYIWLVDQKNLLVRANVVRIQSDKEFAFVDITSEDLKPPLKLILRPLSNFRIGTLVDSNQSAK